MKTATVENTKTIGLLLVTGGLLLFIPYTILTVIFDYPTILRQDVEVVLTEFYKGGPTLILVWFAFALVGLPLLPATILLGQRLEVHFSFVRWATTLGVIGLVVQMIGLLRWTFVVPILAQQFVHGRENIKVACKIAFQVIHQYGGVVLGEHLGQLFSIIWTILLTRALSKVGYVPKWLVWLGYSASGIYIVAQAELIATVIPDFPVWTMAGFIGSTLWLVWLVSTGVVLMLKNKK